MAVGTIAKAVATSAGKALLKKGASKVLGGKGGSRGSGEAPPDLSGFLQPITGGVPGTGVPTTTAEVQQAQEAELSGIRVAGAFDNPAFDLEELVRNRFRATE